MGVKLTGGLICGTCHKPRGLTHTCVTSATSRRRRTRTRLARPRLEWTCPSCQKRRGLAHTCVTKTDFKTRRRRHERRRKAQRKAARKAEATQRRKEAALRRKAAASARRKTTSPRPRPPAHDYHTCRDPSCSKYGCLAYREGIDNCPLPHGG
jgi:hypothetical protein